MPNRISFFDLNYPNELIYYIFILKKKRLLY